MENTSRLNLKNASYRLRILLLALLFCLPLGQQFATSILLLLFAVQALILFKKSDWLSSLSNPIVWSSMAYFAFLLVSLFWSEDWNEGGRQLETKLSFLLVPAFVVAGRKYWSGDMPRRGLFSFILGNSAAILVTLAYASYRSLEAGAPYVVHEFGTRYFFLYTHLSSPIMHPGYMATYVGVALLGLLFLWSDIPRKYKILSSFAGLAMLVFLVMLQARMNVLAIFIVLGVVVLRELWKVKKWYAMLLPGIAILMIALAAYVAPRSIAERYFQFPDFSYDIQGEEFNSATFRLAIWKCNSSIIKENPMIGTGIGDNRLEQKNSYAEHLFWRGLERGFNSHNQYLETMVATGVLGLTIFLFMLGVYIRTAIVSGNRFVLNALIFISLCLVTESMFERVLAVQLFTILFPFMLISMSRSESVNA